MMCLAGSKLHQKALDAYQQCSYLAETGSDMPAGRSIFRSVQAKRGVKERQTSYHQCPPVSEMGIAVNDPNPMYLEDSMTDCVLGAMDFIATEGYPRNSHIAKALDSIIVPFVVENFSYGNTTKQRWNTCRNAFYTTTYTSAWTGEEAGSGSEGFITSV